ncbi:MAG: hypothetical protein K0Q89_2987 [Thermomicrobiales bacterium]|nr:hypothetical protein [Thermomicrobiales bacterium]
MIGTTFPLFPLDRVRTRFHVTGSFPGYRNHFSRVGVALAHEKLKLTVTSSAASQRSGCHYS